MNFYEYQNDSHTLWEEDLENNVSEHNIGSSSPECMSEREEDDEHYSVKRTKFMSNAVEDLIANPHRIQKTMDQPPYLKASEIDPTQLPVPDPPKRKRGRPPGKKKQIKDTLVAFGDQSTFDPLSHTPLSSDSAHGTISGMEPPIPVKRGRGRPRKYPLPNTVAPVVNISMVPKSLMPSDFEICNFVKEAIATSRTSEPNLNDQRETDDRIGFFNDLTNDITALIPPGDKSPYEISNEVALETELSSVPSSPGSSPVIGPSKQTGKDTLTPDAMMRRLEGHYGVNLSSRKHFLYEVFNLLWS